MKKAFSILMLIALLIQMGGVMLLYNGEQFYIRNEMSAKLESGETIFEKLVLSKSDYNRSRINSSEIALDGKMYDVKTVTDVRDSVVLLVINDADEFFLIKKIKDLVGSPINPIQFPNQLQKIFLLFYIAPENECFIFLCFTAAEFLQKGKMKTLADHSNIYAQPPQLV